jgi:tRNA(fMet)-specific endonuclease VapC
MFLLDTNICIDFVDGRSAIAQQRVREHHAQGLDVSAITAAELLVGPKSSDDPVGDRQKVQIFLSLVTVHDFDGRAAEAYADLVRDFGIKRSSFDRLIAAHAIALGKTLVTNNERHFAGVPGLIVENWTK